VHETPANAVGRAAGLLRDSTSTVILVGPACLAHPDRQRLLPAIERLAKVTGTRIIALPEQGNLAGALLLGGFAPEPDGNTLDVLYLVGEDVPEYVSGSPFILYQNIYPPSGSRPADLSLPSAAFTEEEGSFIDYAGRVRQVHPAVEAPGQAPPGWQIMCRIAQAMGASGFDYQSAAEIRAEIAARLPGFRAGERVDWEEAVQVAPVPDCLPAYHYLGFPLSRWVEGLRSLRLEEEIWDADSQDEPDKNSF
jgi:hypothetical protein